MTRTRFPTPSTNLTLLTTALILGLGLSAAGCKVASPDSDGGSASIIASVPSVTGLTADELRYRLLCDPSAANLNKATPTGTTDLTGTATAAGATQNVTFSGAKNAKSGDSCIMQITYAKADITKDPKYASWAWTSLEHTVGLFYSSNMSTLQTSGNSYSLALTLFPTYNDTSLFVAAKVTVTLPTGVSTANPLATGGSLTCGQKGATSTAAAALATAQTIQYTFSVAPDVLVAGQACDFTAQLATAGSTYSQKAAFTPAATQTTYIVATTLTLNPVGTPGQIAVNTTLSECPAGQVMDPTKAACEPTTTTANQSVPAITPPAAQPAPAALFTVTGKTYLGTCDIAAAAGTGYWQENAVFNADTSYTLAWTNYADAACTTAGTLGTYNESGKFAVTAPYGTSGALYVINFQSSSTTVGSYYSLFQIIDAQTIKIDNNKFPDLTKFSAASVMQNSITLHTN